MYADQHWLAYTDDNSYKPKGCLVVKAAKRISQGPVECTKTTQVSARPRRRHGRI